jgi:hypothetical protein
MSARATAVIATRLIGLVLLLIGAALALGQALAFVQFLRWLHWHFSIAPDDLSAGEQFGLSLSLAATAVCGVVLGWYLLFRGRRVHAWLLAGLGPECATCGYSLKGVPGATCPECGTPTGAAPEGRASAAET